VTAEDVLDRVAELIAASEKLVIDRINASEARVLEAIHADGKCRTCAEFDPRVAKYARLLAAIADALGVDPHLPFNTTEILELGHTSEPLATALAALDAHDARRLGAIFRSTAKLEDCGGLRLRREGEAWALTRT